MFSFGSSKSVTPSPPSAGVSHHHHRSTSSRSSRTASSSTVPSTSRSTPPQGIMGDDLAGEEERDVWTDDSNDEHSSTVFDGITRGVKAAHLTSSSSNSSIHKRTNELERSRERTETSTTITPASLSRTSPPPPALSVSTSNTSSSSKSWSSYLPAAFASAASSPTTPTATLRPSPVANAATTTTAAQSRPMIVSEEEKKRTREEEDRLGMDGWRAAIQPNVEELMKDPASLLQRPTFLSTFSSPPLPVASISSPSDRRPSVSSNRSAVSNGSDDDEDDETAGYVSLNATNLSSSGPEVVEFNRVEGVEYDGQESGERGRERRRRSRFVECLEGENVDVAELRKLAWAGIPNELRPMAWQLLLGYLPTPASRRVPTLARKRQEYADAVRLAFAKGEEGLDSVIWHQICIDVPRTNSGIRLWQGAETQRSLERILYVWAIRHPASGYVQGINDLVTPFFQVFLSAYITTPPESYNIAALPPHLLEALEADSFWCLSKLLDGIQDNYIFAQPGITRQVGRMRELCKRVDAPLAAHLELHQVEFIQFAFRWMNCLLMRELSVGNIIRMWDTYLAEGTDAFSEFHLYVCLAFLVKWSEQLREMDFQSIIMFLQSLPTKEWTDKNTELLLSEAFMWSRTFQAR